MLGTPQSLHISIDSCWRSICANWFCYMLLLLHIYPEKDKKQGVCKWCFKYRGIPQILKSKALWMYFSGFWIYLEDKRPLNTNHSLNETFERWRRNARISKFSYLFWTSDCSPSDGIRIKIRLSLTFWILILCPSFSHMWFYFLIYMWHYFSSSFWSCSWLVYGSLHEKYVHSLGMSYFYVLLLSEAYDTEWNGTFSFSSIVSFIFSGLDAWFRWKENFT